MPQIGIEIGPNSIAASQIKKNLKGKQDLVFFELFYGSQAQERNQGFLDFIKNNTSKNTPCNLVLHPSCYRLLLVDAPEVPQHELKEAMRWRIKDLISEPIEQVVIDTISLPYDAYQGRMNMVYVAVAPLSLITPHVELILQSNLNLISVDIPELALRNLSLLHSVTQTTRDLTPASNDASSAIICIKESGSFVSILSENSLYLTRNIDVNLETLHDIANDNEPATEQLIMEIQRSLDYYESQMGKGNVESILFAPAASRGFEKSIDFLNENFSVNIKALDLLCLFNTENEISIPEQAHGLCSIGGALKAQ